MDIMSPGLNIAGPQCPIVVNSGSTPTSLVWKGLTEFITIGQTQTFSRIAIRGCSLNISKNHSLPLGLLSKCICHRHGLCLCLCCCFLLGQVMFCYHSDQMSQRSKVSKIALWRCSLNVFVIVFVIVFVFAVVFLLVRSCFLITLIKCLKGQKSLGLLFEGVR